MLFVISVFLFTLFRISLKSFLIFAPHHDVKI